jgi:anti-sigma B factor antagonist
MAVLCYPTPVLFSHQLNQQLPQFSVLSHVDRFGGILGETSSMPASRGFHGFTIAFPGLRPVSVQCHRRLSRSLVSRELIGQSTFAVVSETRDSTVILRVRGDLDLLTAPILDEALSAALDGVTAHGTVLLDVSTVGFVGSSGLAQFVKYHRLFVAQGVRLVVVTGTNRVVLRPLTLLQLDLVLDLADTIENALAVTS